MESDEKSQLTSILAEYTSQPTLYFQTVNIGETQTVAFAETQNKNGYSTDIWYVTSSGATLLINIQPDTFDDTQNTPQLWMVGDAMIFKCEDGGSLTGSQSYVWYLKDGVPVSLGHMHLGQDISYMGMELTYLGNNQFTVMFDTYDGFSDTTGHTWKLYYLYWPDDGDNFEEYGGIEISQQQLLEADGANAIFDVLNQSGKQISSIYYRANGIININCSSPSDDIVSYSNITLKYNQENNSVMPVPLDTSYLTMKINNSDNVPFNADTLKQFLYRGTYEAALFPLIATYPTQFPPS